MRFGTWVVSAALLLLSSCSNDDAGSSNPASTAGTSGTGGAAGSGGTAGTAGVGGTAGTGGSGGTIDKAANCTDTFGDALTNAFGRVDGTVLAVLGITDLQCPMPNSDHVIIEVTMNGAVYRMVVNVQSSFGNPDVDYLVVNHALPAPAWEEGWHPGLSLDYVADFGVKSDDFSTHAMPELSKIVVDAIPLGEKISIYASSSGGASAHKIHRNDGTIDGAIVLDPGGPNSRALLFHFLDQTF